MTPISSIALGGIAAAVVVYFVVGLLAKTRTGTGHQDPDAAAGHSGIGPAPVASP